MYEDVLVHLKRFEVEHEYWDLTTFMKPDNKTVIQFVTSLVKTSPELDSLVKSGSIDDIDSLYMLLKSDAIIMSLPMMHGLLTVMFEYEKAQEPISRNIVEWFRTMGWSFPEFEFEKIEKQQTNSRDQSVE